MNKYDGKKRQSIDFDEIASDQLRNEFYQNQKKKGGAVPDISLYSNDAHVSYTSQSQEQEEEKLLKS